MRGFCLLLLFQVSLEAARLSGMIAAERQETD